MVRGLVESALRVSRVSHRKLMYSTDMKMAYDNYVRRKRTVPSYVQGDRGTRHQSSSSSACSSPSLFSFAEDLVCKELFNMCHDVVK
jgi:hypothetical protein